MNPEEWQRVVDLYDRLVDLPQQEQAAALEQSREAPETIEEVRKLLDQRPPTNFVEPPSGGSAARIQPDRIQPGAVLGGHIIEREIGRGGMGIVYAAHEPSLDRRVAIKVVPIDGERELEILERFRREAKLASRLDHSNVVPVLAYGETSEVLWYSMRMIEGHNLADEIAAQREARRPAPADGAAKARYLQPFDHPDYITEVTTKVAEIAHALVHCHASGITHRDIKPQNLLVSPEAHLYLVDFGLAKHTSFETLTEDGALRGTPSYMSPEQARAESRAKQVDHRTDIYSLCVVLYELLTLQRPHSGSTLAELLRQVLEQDPTPVHRLNPRVPEPLALVIAKGMEKSRRDRYETALELAEDLERFLRHEAVLASPPSLFRRARRLAYRFRMGWLAAGLVLLGAAGAMGLLKTSQRGLLVERLEERAAALMQAEDWSGEMSNLASLRDDVLRARLEEGEAPGLDPFLARLEEFREAGLGAAEDLIARGTGSDRALEFRESKPPIAPELVAEGMTMLQNLESVFPEDAVLAGLSAWDRFYPEIEIRCEIVDEDVVRAPRAGEALVYVREIDFFLDSMSEPRLLGSAPLAPLALPAGDYCFQVLVPGFGQADLIRTLGTAQAATLASARVHAAARVHAEMVRVPSGAVELLGAEGVGCLYVQGASVVVPGFWIGRREVSNGELYDYLAASGAEAPRNWDLFGFDGTQASLAGGTGAVERWRSLPAVSLSHTEARMFLEWHGLRLPLHVELEYAHAGSAAGTVLVRADDRWPAQPDLVLANVFGPSATETASGSPARGYAAYRDACVSVFDERFSQGAWGLIHAYGNVGEMSASRMTESVGGRLLLVPDVRVSVGAYYGSAADDQGLNIHGKYNESFFYYRVQTGFRSATSEFISSSQR